MSHLAVENLGFRYERRPIFRGLSFSVGAGELVQVLGPNGTGKSTLLGILAGLMPQTSGTIHFKDPSGERVDDLRVAIEFLPAEANGLFLKMDATQNLSFWTAMRGLKPERTAIHAQLSDWGLGHPLLREHFAVEKFSTGMKRRLALARVGLSPSPCWLLDEPVYGLDTKGIAVFRAMLARHLDRGGMAVVVSHESVSLESFARRTIDLSAYGA